MIKYITDLFDKPTDVFSKEIITFLEGTQPFERIQYEHLFETVYELKLKSEKHDFLTEIIDNSPNLILYTDEDGIILQASKELHYFFGYKVGELLGKDVNILVPNAHKRSHAVYVKKYLETGKSQILSKGRNVKAMHKSGREIPIYIKIKHLIVEGKDFYITSIQDTQELEQVSEQLREQSYLSNVLFNANHDMAFLINPQGDIESSNKSGAIYFGYTEHSVINKNIFKLLNLKKSPLIEKIEQALKEKQNLQFTETIFDHVLHFNITPIIDNGNTVTKLALFIKDITEITKAQNKINEKEALIFQLTESISIGVFIISPKNKSFTFINKAMTEISGLSKDEFMLGKWFDIIHPNDQAVVYQKWEDSLNNYRHLVLEHRLLLLNGKEKTVFFQASIFKHLNFDEKDPVYLGTMIDITERKKMESNLKNAIAEAVKANEMKSKFLANMSHEIRTPLNAIIGFSDLIQNKDISNENIYKFIKAIDTSATNLMTLIDEILDFAKIEAGKVHLVEKPFNLKNLFQSIYDVYYFQSKEKNIPLILSIDDNIPEILYGDQGRINQIFVNLISNSYKYTNSGLVDCSVRKVKETNSKIMLECSISDTGIGIKKEMHAKVFDYFVQSENEMQGPQNGYGLGLSIVKNLVELMGGTIAINSERKQGTQINFTLWVGRDTNHNVDSNRLLDYDKQFISKKVLLVEDNIMNQILARELLEGYGLEVDLAENGQEAIYKVLEKGYDLILMDIRMPIMNGIEAAKIIRSMKGTYANIPIIALTAHVLQDDLANYKEVGINEVISKPYRENELYTKIAIYLQKDSRNVEKASYTPKAVHSQQYLNLEEVKKFANDKLLVPLLHSFVDISNEFMKTTEVPISKSNIEQLHFVTHKIKSPLQLFGIVTEVEITEILNCFQNNTPESMQLLESCYSNLRAKVERARNEASQLIQQNIS